MNGRRGISIIELMVTIMITGIVMGGVYKVLYIPYRTQKILNDAVQLQIATRSLDIIATDFQQAEAALFPYDSAIVTPTGTTQWISRVNLLMNNSTDVPYVFVQYRYNPTTQTQGQLLRYFQDTKVPLAGDNSVAAVTPTIVADPIARPGSTLPDGTIAPDLFHVTVATDPIVISIAYEPHGITLPGGNQAVYNSVRRVYPRN